MEKEFVPYELALKLKELGFDEECLGAYGKKGNFLRCTSKSWNLKSMKILNDYFGKGSYEYLAPLYQQAFDWFEKEHRLYSSQDNLLLDYCLIDCRNDDMLIIKSIGADSNLLNSDEVRKNRLRHLIQTI